MARNAKVKWVSSWRNAADAEKKVKALQSTYLIEAYEEYERAYNEDLNHFYSGINAFRASYSYHLSCREPSRISESLDLIQKKKLRKL